MASKYERASEDVIEMVEELMKNYHQELDALGVTFDVLLGYAPVNDSGERTGPALKKNKRAVMGLTGITPLKERVKGLADAEIIIDGDRFYDLAEEQQRAVLDRCLYEIVIRRDVDGGGIQDAYGRYKLSKREPDCYFEGFNAIAERHGESSVEVEQMKSICSKTKELYFPFMESGALALKNTK